MELDIAAYLSARKEIIDNKLLEFLPELPDSVSRLQESMRYSILAGGKRLRPILCIAACEAVGGTLEKSLPIACAIEMIHTYSLIHDDLPSMDDDEMRRGIPTNHKVFGEAAAILAGDALLTDAFLIIAKEGVLSGLHPSLIVEVIQDIAEAAGSRGMVMGQAIDLAIEGKEAARETIDKLHSLKTGALIEASVTSGARIGGASSVQISNLRQYAKCIGLSFQIIDDVLDIEGGAETGKDKGADNRKHKATYPSIMGIERAKIIAIDLIKKAVLSLDGFDESAEPLREIAFYLGGRKY